MLKNLIVRFFSFALILLFLWTLFFSTESFAVSPAAGLKPVIWLINASALLRLKKVPGASSLVKLAFDHSHTIVIIGKHSPLFLKRWKCQWALSFPSYHSFSSRMREEGISPRVKFILLDQESWRFTPKKEKLNPSIYVKKAVMLAHQFGLKLAAAPAVDLVNSELRKIRRFHLSRYSAFLNLKIPKKVGSYADLYEIQAQGSEMDPELYRSFVERASQQARQSNQNLIVLAGLSTNPNGQKVTAEMLYQDFKAVKSDVNGYWLNVPAGGPWCPRCGKPDLKVGIDFIKQVIEKIRPTHLK